MKDVIRRNQMKQEFNIDTIFCAFINFKKAYKWVKRGLLFTKLESLGLKDAFYHLFCSSFLSMISLMRSRG